MGDGLGVTRSLQFINTQLMHVFLTDKMESLLLNTLWPRVKIVPLYHLLLQEMYIYQCANLQELHNIFTIFQQPT